MINSILITLDTDWAPDFILSDVAEILSNKNIKATWFVTNNSIFLDSLKKNKLFEIGIHPNFESNSTHGEDFDSVLNNLKQIVPQAKSSRSHSLFQSSKLFQKFDKYGIENDVSLFLPNSINPPLHYLKFANLYRFPFNWEDDIALREHDDLDINKYNLQGLQIFNFHPIHLYLNSNNLELYEKLKTNIGIPNLTEKNIKKYVNPDHGVKTFFLELLNLISNKQSYTIMDLQLIYKDALTNQMNKL
jgi:hypothetical protein